MQPVSPSKLSSSRGHEDPLCSAARRTPARATAFYDTIIKVRRAWVDYRSGAARPLLGYLERTRELFRTRRGDRTLRLSGCKWPLANVRSRPIRDRSESDPEPPSFLETPATSLQPGKPAACRCRAGRA